MIKTFDNYEEALEWMSNECEDGTMDNIRFAYYDDEKALHEYDEKLSRSCCGQFDADITISNRAATIGCNYGH